eukprot:gene38888-48020_t
MRLEKRNHTSPAAYVLAPVGAVVFTLLISGLLVLWAGAPVGRTYALLLQGAFGSVFALTETLTRATPLILTGLAAAVAFRARLFNIGAEGQLYAGALAAVAVGGMHGGTGRAVGDAAATATAKLDMPALLALAAALGWASGFRLYAVVFLVGMMGVLGWMPLPPGLAMLQHPLVLMVSGFMLMVEFFADKVPWVDSAWDAIHAFIRVPAGAALAYGVFGADNATMAVVAGLLGGSLSATALATKMTTRAAVNTSPEPFSNWGLSFFEDGLVVAVVWLATQHPVAFGVALVVMVVVSVLLLVVLFKFLRAVVRRLSSFFSGSAKVV